MPKAHAYAQILRAIADGCDIQWQNSKGVWEAEDADDALADIAGDEFGPERYRLKPKTININGHEVPESLRVAPKPGATFWMPVVNTDEGVHYLIWKGSPMNLTWLARGLVHDNREAAVAHAKALLSFTETQP